jgi:hypothetical protein
LVLIAAKKGYPSKRNGVATHPRESFLRFVFKAAGLLFETILTKLQKNLRMEARPERIRSSRKKKEAAGFVFVRYRVSS